MDEFREPKTRCCSCMKWLFLKRLINRIEYQQRLTDNVSEEICRRGRQPVKDEVASRSMGRVYNPERKLRAQLGLLHYCKSQHKPNQSCYVAERNHRVKDCKFVCPF